MKNKITVIITLILLALTQVNCHRGNYAVRMLNSAKAGDAIQIYRAQYPIHSVIMSYIILYPNEKIWQLYSTWGYGSSVGQFTIHEDTIDAVPMLYFNTNYIEVFCPDSIPSVVSIPRKYLLRENSLIDITKYGAIYMNEPPYTIIMDSLWPQTRQVFIRMNFKNME